MIFPHMNSIIRNQFQILNPIVGFNAIDMVYDFVRQKTTTEKPFHYETVLTNISATIGIWMTQHSNKNIPTSHMFPAFPGRMLRAFLSTKESSVIHTHESSSFWRRPSFNTKVPWPQATLTFPIALIRAKLSLISILNVGLFRRFMEGFFTNLTLLHMSNIARGVK